MHIHHAFEQSNGSTPSVCTIGTFDGVHLGHQQLIRAAIDDAHARAAQSVVITFYPHPRVVLANAPINYLSSPAEKAEQMQRLGVDVLLVLPFTQQTAQTPAAQFVDWMRAHLNLQALWIGHDFALGHRRQGNADFLRAQGHMHGFAVNVLPEFSLGPRLISSTRIRAALARGDILDANLCLGRPFRLPCTLCDQGLLCGDPHHLRPAPGRYAVFIDDAPNEVCIEAERDLLTLAHPIIAAGEPLAVDFHHAISVKS